jgi:hypothetical protein
MILALQSRLHARLRWPRPQRRAGDCGGRSGEGGEGSKQRMRLYRFTLSLMTALMLTGCAGGNDGGAPTTTQTTPRLRRRGRDSRSHECEQIGTRTARHLLRRFGGHRLLIQEDRLHRLQILERELAEVVLQHNCTAVRPVSITRGPALPKPRSANHFPASIRRPFARSFSMTESMYSAITPPSSPTSSRTRRLSPVGLPPGLPLMPGAKPSPAARCFGSALNEAHAVSVPIVAGDRFCA